MSGPDLINGVFEACGSVAIWINVAAIRRDKQVRGYRLAPAAFFMSWGLWNLFYYPNLHQWFSFLGGASLALANVVWAILTAYYIRKEKRAAIQAGV